MSHSIHLLILFNSRIAQEPAKRKKRLGWGMGLASPRFSDETSVCSLLSGYLSICRSWLLVYLSFTKSVLLVDRNPLCEQIMIKRSKLIFLLLLYQNYDRYQKIDASNTEVVSSKVNIAAATNQSEISNPSVILERNNNCIWHVTAILRVVTYEPYYSNSFVVLLITRSSRLHLSRHA